MRLLLYLAVVVAVQFPGLADGMFVTPSRAMGAQAAKSAEQKAVIVREGSGTEVLVLQTTYNGPASDFAWVVPVPGLPTETDVFPASADFIPEVLSATEPAFKTDIEEPLSEHVPRRYMGRDAATGGIAMPGKAMLATPPVTVHSRFQTGDYDVAILSSTGGMALESWLLEYAFAVPAGAAPVLAHYVAKSWYFVALRIRPDVVANQRILTDVRPIGIRFPAEKLVFPLEISRLSSRDHTAITLVVIDGQPTRCDQLQPAVLPLDEPLETGVTYSAVRLRAAEEQPRSVVVEAQLPPRSFPSYTLAPPENGPPPSIEGVATRMWMRLPLDDLHDLSFTPVPGFDLFRLSVHREGAIYHSPFVLAVWWPPTSLLVWALIAALAVLVVWRFGPVIRETPLGVGPVVPVFCILLWYVFDAYRRSLATGETRPFLGPGLGSGHLLLAFSIALVGWIAARIIQEARRAEVGPAPKGRWALNPLLPQVVGVLAGLVVGLLPFASKAIWVGNSAIDEAQWLSAVRHFTVLCAVVLATGYLTHACVKAPRGQGDGSSPNEVEGRPLLEMAVVAAGVPLLLALVGALVLGSLLGSSILPWRTVLGAEDLLARIVVDGSLALKLIAAALTLLWAGLALCLCARAKCPPWWRRSGYVFGLCLIIGLWALWAGRAFSAIAEGYTWEPFAIGSPSWPALVALMLIGTLLLYTMARLAFVLLGCCVSTAAPWRERSAGLTFGLIVVSAVAMGVMQSLPARAGYGSHIKAGGIRQLDDALRELDRGLLGFLDAHAAYPARLEDLAAGAPPSQGVDSSGNPVDIVEDTTRSGGGTGWPGRLTRLPVDPLTGRRDTWVYEPTGLPMIDSGGFRITVRNTGS